MTAPTMHAGFGDNEGASGYLGRAIQLEIWNVGRLSIVLDAGLPVCQAGDDGHDGPDWR
jgi:dCTP deaminase